jgi:hypothetical protein
MLLPTLLPMLLHTLLHTMLALSYTALVDEAFVGEPSKTCGPVASISPSPCCPLPPCPPTWGGPKVIAQFGNGTGALPLLLHDGESSNTSDTNFIDAVLLGSTRVGHAYNAFMFPAAVAAARAANISFDSEVCPLSNQALRLAPSNLTDHPGRAYLTSDGVEVGRCTLEASW